MAESSARCRSFQWKFRQKLVAAFLRVRVNCADFVCNARSVQFTTWALAGVHNSIIVRITPGPNSYMNTSFIFSFMFGIITATFTLTAAASSSSSKTKILEQNEFRARQSERIRQQLSDNLSNFHNNITPEPLRINYERLLGFPVPLDLTFKIAEFFDKETFDSFSLCEKRFLKFKRDFYALKLYKFDPNCVFPDHWPDVPVSNWLAALQGTA